MKILLVAGARPNFMKIASIIDALNLYNRSSAQPLQHLLVHTGQHYDASMSQAFFRDLGLPQPDIDLEVGSASHAQQTAEIMKRVEPVLMREHPDVVVVVGDVNSTIACALVAAKIAYPSRVCHRSRPLIAHVEAGLRSFDHSMPEEINRSLTDAISDLLFLTEARRKQTCCRRGSLRKNALCWQHDGGYLVQTSAQSTGIEPTLSTWPANGFYQRCCRREQDDYPALCP
jgi:UDP-N-acetylglucosamine 2-epimerase (non-hydrolysing)